MKTDNHKFIVKRADDADWTPGLRTEFEYRDLGIRDVDVDSLSTHKLAAIHQIAHLKRPRGGKRALPSSAFQRRNVRSLPAVARMLPSGLQATVRTSC